MGKITVKTLNLDESHFEIGKNVVSLFYGNSGSGYFEWNRPLWFLPCLIVVELLWFLILKMSGRFSKSKDPVWKAYVGTMALSAANMVFITYGGIRFILPFELETALSMLFFFGAGLLFRNKAFEAFTDKYFFAAKKSSQYVYLALGTGLSVLLAILNGGTDTRTDIFSNVFIYIPNALCACLSVILLARVICRSRWMEYIGQRTMAILTMHKFPIMFLRVMFPFVDRRIAERNILCEVAVCAFAIGCCLAAEKIISMILPQAFGKSRK